MLPETVEFHGLLCACQCMSNEELTKERFRGWDFRLVNPSPQHANGHTSRRRGHFQSHTLAVGVRFNAWKLDETWLIFDITYGHLSFETSHADFSSVSGGRMTLHGRIAVYLWLSFIGICFMSQK